MPRNTESRGKNLYPLAEHFLGILDSKDPMATLKKEVIRYKEWEKQEREELEQTYGEGLGDPRNRIADTWEEQDTDFVFLDSRRQLLSVVLEAVKMEESLIPDIRKEGGSEKGILQLLQGIFEQLDELPCPEKNIVPGEFSVSLPAPMQRMTVETKDLHQKQKACPSGNTDLLYDMQILVLELMFEKWALELLPKEMLKHMGSKAYGISKGWKLVVFNPV